MKQMTRREQLKNEILQVNAASFKEVSLAVFHYQAANNPLYAHFLSLLSISPQKVQDLEDIPFLPIQFFKNYQIQSGTWAPEVIFTSSGTTGTKTSRHLVRDLDFYRQIAEKGFLTFYPPLEQHCLLALLPSYLERSGSSLVYMVEQFMQKSRGESGFYLHDEMALLQQIQECQEKGIPVLLIGVSFALLDLAERKDLDLTGVTVIETGGMKGRRRELTRAELHGQLTAAFGLQEIHSEYGMTELMSQAWSTGAGLFRCSPTMKIFTREISDPLTLQQAGRPGAINIIDLGNLDSISFIATDDLGRVQEEGNFEILGRMDGSDLRGCNLLLGEA